MKILCIMSVVFLFTNCNTDTIHNEKEFLSVENEIIVQEELEPLEVFIEELPITEELVEEDAQEWGTGCLTNFSAYLNDPGEAYTNIRNKPSGDIVLQLPWGELEEEYMITVVEFVDGWFRIEGTIIGTEEDIEIPGGMGWVHPSVVATDTRNYDNQSISLYECPEETCKVTSTIDQESGGLKVLTACRDWVLIELSYDDYYRKGWMKTKWCCGNPLTSCS